jgi:SAM-dependent methyltransferase
MELNGRALAPRFEDTRAAFDGVAASYDGSNRANPVLRAMRQRAIEALVTHVPRGGRVLDLGCGPGTDEATLVEAGYTVTAVDWSPAMVAEARRQVARVGVEEHVQVRELDIQELDRLEAGVFDAACSNLGPLNCVPDLARAADLIARRLRPGGVLMASVIGRICPWEIAVFLARRDWRRLQVRFASGFAPVGLNGRTVWTRYYTPREFEQVFERAGFERISRRALGLLVPPPYLEGFTARHGRLVETLWRFEDRIAHLPVARSCGDHFLVVMRRRLER